MLDERKSPSSRFTIRPADPLAVALLSIALVVFFAEWSFDQTLIKNLVRVGFVISFLLLIWSLCIILTGRLLVSLVSVGGLTVFIVVVSKVKFGYLANLLSAYDVYFHFGNFVELQFFVRHYASLALVLAVLFLALVTTLVLIWRLHGRRIGRMIGVASAILSVVCITVMSGPQRPQDFNWRSSSDQHQLSVFFSSVLMLSKLSGREFALPTGDSRSAIADLQAIPSPDEVKGIKPHIIVILHESSVDPSIYFEGEQFEVPKAFFASGDGKTRRLGVHTWGGGTWVSEYGFLLGLDVSYFEDAKGFLGYLGVGKFANTVPQELRRLGYRTIAHYPSPTAFMNTAKFYNGVGFDEVLSEKDIVEFIDRRDVGPDDPFGRIRDRTYYEYLLQQIKFQLQSSQTEPQFHFLWTTSTHYPYEKVAFPDVRATETEYGLGPAEFARRQRIAADDLVWLKKELTSLFPNEPFLLAGFGDHHPRPTHGYFYRDKQGSTPFLPKAKEEKMVTTYYRVDGVNFLPSYSGLSEFSEIGFLGESLLEAARLPPSRSFATRRWLRKICEGLWAKCSNEGVVLGANAVLSEGPSSVFALEQ